MDKKIIKIAVVGPESTGKSSISAALAKHYQTLWVPEFARYYCSNLKTECTLQDELNMFYGQLALEEAIIAVADKNLIFCDTTFLTVKVWSDYQLGETPKIVLEHLKTNVYDFYLLMNIDIPWQDDPLRDFKGLSAHFFDIWQNELMLLNAKYEIISGIGEDRIKNAIKSIDNYLSFAKV